jgi:hypothetical protein
MEQLTSSFLTFNVDGQQRLPFQTVRNAAAAAAAVEFIPSYPVNNTEPFSLYPMTFKIIPNCQSASANQPSANQPTTSKQMDVEEDEEMLSASVNSQTAVRRSERLAAKPRINYKEIATIE